MSAYALRISNIGSYVPRAHNLSTVGPGVAARIVLCNQGFMCVQRTSFEYSLCFYIIAQRNPTMLVEFIGQYFNCGRARAQYTINLQLRKRSALATRPLVLFFLSALWTACTWSLIKEDYWNEGSFSHWTLFVGSHLWRPKNGFGCGDVPRPLSTPLA